MLRCSQTPFLVMSGSLSLRLLSLLLSTLRSRLWLPGVLLVVVPGVQAQQNPQGQMPVGEVDDPLIWLIRDSFIQDQIEAQPTQRAQLRSLSDEVDARIWPARNQGAATSLRVWNEQSQRVRDELPGILSEAQRRRLDEIAIRLLGLRAVQRRDFADRLELTAAQRSAFDKTFEEIQQHLAALRARREQGEDTVALQREQSDFVTEKQTAILQQITREQRYEWRRAMGDELALDSIGYVDFRAPALAMDHAVWLEDEAQPYAHRKVTILHFFACNCFNCWRNYPHYQRWHEQYSNRNVQVLGIHTPETNEERQIDFLRRKVAESELEFPILVDHRSENWNAWGNSMWPSVYIIDSRGRVRAWWIGELNWEGADGDKQLEAMIEKILAEEEER